MSKDEYLIEAIDDSINLKGPLFQQDDSSEQWAAKELGLSRVLVQPKKVQDQMGGSNYGNIWCAVDVFADLLIGLMHRRWTGTVQVDTGDGIKRIFFDRGHIVFATTTNIDERLGEIIYRKGMLSLDDLMNCSVQVTKKEKFGQVLLRDKVFTNAQLWVALKSQVKEIVRSIFMVEHVYFELNPDAPPAPTEVVYLEGTDELIDGCYGYGCMFRDFVSRISHGNLVSIKNYEYLMKHLGASSFKGDMLNLIHQEKNIGNILKGSKLSGRVTLASLMDFANMGFCAVEEFAKTEVKYQSHDLARLRKQLDVYTQTLSEVSKSFDEHQLLLPVQDIRQMAASLDDDRSFAIYITEQGHLSQGSIERIFSQCKTAYKRSRFFEKRIRLLTTFLLQIAGDNLPYTVAKAIRNSTRNLNEL